MSATGREQRALSRNANKTAPRTSSAPVVLLPWRRSFPSNDSRRPPRCWGDGGACLPADRSVLKDLHKTTEGDTIGEGSVVQLIGFLIKAKFSNVGKGETVNCEPRDQLPRLAR